MSENKIMTRAGFVKGAAVSCAAIALGLTFKGLKAFAQSSGGSGSAAPGEWVSTACQGCTSWCSVQVFVEGGRAVKIRGNPDSKVNMGQCCSKSHLAIQEMYDPDRVKTPMKRTNPRKGRNEDPGFTPISWDEALDAIADRIMELRRNNETHKYVLFRGRYSGMANILYDRLTKIIGSPNNIAHSSICAEAEKFGPYYTEGFWNYRQYDVLNSRYIILWGADPLSANRQVSYYLSVWGDVIDKATVAVIDPRFSASAAKADHWLPVKPGQDGALAVAMAHVILTEGLWSREFVGDFTDGQNRFVAGSEVSEDAFEEKHTHGLVKWWNIELKDRTPEWAADKTGIPAEKIREVAVGFGRAAPNAICWVGGGPAMQPRGAYASMATHALNGLVGSVDNVGGTLRGCPVYTRGFPGHADYLDDTARAGLGHATIDQSGRLEFPSLKEGKPGSAVVTNRVADAILDEDPYDVKVAIAYMNNFAFSCPQTERWERALSKLPFLVHITTNAAEFSWFADIILPSAITTFEKWGFVTSNANSYSQAPILRPLVDPVWDVKMDETEMSWMLAEKLAERGFDNAIRHFRTYVDPETGKEPKDGKEFSLFALKLATRDLWDPANHRGGDRLNGWEDYLKKGVWNSDPYRHRQHWSNMQTKTGKFEFYSETLKDALAAHAEKHSVGVDDVLNVCNYQASGETAFVPHYEEPLFKGDASEYPFALVDYKSRLNREGRSANTSWYHEFKGHDPGNVSGEDVAAINPIDGKRLGLSDGDRIRLESPVGRLECKARLWEGTPPGVVAKCYGQGHWAYGRLASAEFGKRPRGGNNNDIIPAEYDRLSGSTAFYGHIRVKVVKI